jgi:hypothetical protein
VRGKNHEFLPNPQSTPKERQRLTDSPENGKTEINRAVNPFQAVASSNGKGEHWYAHEQDAKRNEAAQ